MAEDLKYLLFNRNVKRKDDSLKSLFRFQSELAKEIVDDAESAYQDADSIRPYLNQTLKYDGRKKGKPMSHDLRTAIIKAAKSRLSKEDKLYKNLEEEFDSAYASLIHGNRLKNFNVDDIEFRVLTEWQKKSNLTVVFTREPLEVKWLKKDISAVSAGDLINDLFENILKNFSLASNESTLTLGELYNAIDTNDNIRLKSSNSNEQYFYRYYIASFNVAKTLWQGLINFIYYKIKSELKLADSDRAFDLSFKIVNLFNGLKGNIKVDSNYNSDNAFLKVYKTEGCLITVPLVYYECAKGIIDTRNNIKNHEMLFTLIMDKDGNRSVSIIGNDDLRYWKEQNYYPLLWSNENKFKIEEINLFKASSHIKRTINEYKNGK